MDPATQLLTVSSFNPFGAHLPGRIDEFNAMGRYPRGRFLHEAQERDNRSMHLIRFVRISVPFVSLALVGFVLGCSGGGQGVTPPDKEASKKIAEDMKSAQQERMKAMRSQTQGRGPR
jgi:hypothetical protein